MTDEQRTLAIDEANFKLRVIEELSEVRTNVKTLMINSRVAKPCIQENIKSQISAESTRIKSNQSNILLNRALILLIFTLIVGAGLKEYLA